MTESASLTVQSTCKYLVGVVLFVLLGACGGGDSSSGTGGGGSSSSQGTLAVQLTDAHTDSVSEVNVHIVGLMIKPSDGPVQMLNCCDTTVDLLTLVNSTQLLVAAEVPAGSYEFIQVILDEGQSSVVENGEAKALQIPSEKIKVLGGFEVLPDGTTTVLLDFDAEESLVLRGDGEWLLQPVILMANVTMS